MRIARDKKEIINFLRRDGAPERAVERIVRIADHRPVPLSFAQERLWFLEQLDPGRSVYNLCRAIRTAGRLNYDALEGAVNEIVRRHEALRTRFVAVDGRPEQIILPPAPVSLRLIDLSGLPETTRKQQTRRLILREARRPFDLRRGRLLRIRLLRCAGDEHVLIFSTHHIVSDAWSMGILNRDLWAAYRHLVDGESPALPELSIRYRDYAARQREQFEGEVFQADLIYWKTKLAGAPVLDLPSDRARPVRQTSAGTRRHFALSSELTAALSELSKREGVTLFMTLLAVFHALLSRYSGQDDIVVGSPVANRDRAELEEVVGLFVNTLALRVDLSGQPSFRDLLRRVRETCLDGLTHQKVPLEKLVETLNPDRDLARNPLFQTIFVFQNTPIRQTNPPGLKLTSTDVDNRTAQFDLSLYLREREGTLLGFFEYSTELFDSATMDRMVGHFQTLLEAAAASPDESIVKLPLLTAKEHRQLLIEWNATAAAYPKNACIHELFEAQVEGAPEAIALEMSGRTLNYRQLNHRANTLAQRLRELGSGPGTLVGIMLSRGFDMIASLLAILKTGAAYVPLDPSYPQERLKFMIDDAGVGILLTQKKFAKRFSHAAITVFVDRERRAAPSSTNPPSGAAADSPAYIIYTSGSTGNPKGVVGRHRGAVNRFAWMWETYPFAPGEKIGQKTSLSFVDSVWEIFGALLCGVPTVLVPEPAAKDPDLLVRYLAQHRVTRLVVVPSLLREILGQADLRKRLARLKLCFTSGEALSADLAKRFRKVLPYCKLVNLYGSSEVSADATCAEVDGVSAGETISIGRPIQNTQIYILDAHRQPVPIGVRGELYVGGDNLARGYLNRPGLTAEKFIANPFSADPNCRLFKSGDLARYRADGNIEFLGRADDQVKIRGCRIELSEIETALNRHPAIQESAVVIGDTAEQLIAYFVSLQREPPSLDLRRFLREKLPDYMVPASFIRVETLPRLPNGKIDRRALLASDKRDRSPERNRIGPRTEMEEMIAQIWQEVLHIENAGVDNSFFDLGGHSLLAAQVAAKLRAILARPVAVRDLFEAPTVAALAARIEKRSGAEIDMPVVQSRASQHDMPLSFSQGQLFLFSQLFGGGDFLNMPYAYRLAGPLQVAVLKRAIREIVRRHVTLRTAFIDTAQGARQSILPRVSLKLPVVDLARLPAEKREQKLEEISRRDAMRVFDLETPPLLRVTLIRLADEQHVLLVTMHHIISDQWSMGVFRNELAALYEAFSTGDSSPLADLPYQFFDFVSWQRQQLKRGTFDRQIAYWRKRLAGARPTLEFRGRGEYKNAPRYQSARRALHIDHALFAGIKAFARAQHCTPFMVFLAGLDILLYRYTGARDIRIGTLVANRGREGTDKLIGYFVNALVLRVRISPAMRCQELLTHVRETCLDAYANQDLPFEYLESLLNRQHGRGAAPLYQVMLNYRNQRTPEMTSAGLTIAPWNGKHRATDPGLAMARLDVNFHLHEVSTALTGAVNYKTDLFDQARIAKFISDYWGVLGQVTDRPEKRISSLVLS